MSVTVAPAPFALDAPLVPGVTVLEASAGTGKTYAVTGLAARLVAEGVGLERILLVSFTRMATGELRERVRERLVSVERALREHPGAAARAGGAARDPGGAGRAGGAARDPDPVVALLTQRGVEAVRQAVRRLSRALSDFDAATITTTHGFCQEALGGLGIAADLEPGVTFVEDLSDLVGEALDDLYVRRFYRDGNPAFTRAQALAIAQIAVDNPGAEIAPANGEVPEMRRRLAQAVREELEERKRRLSVMTYDDLLLRLRAALAGPDGDAVAARLRARYDVVLVDEFQDTDPVQWEIMRLGFAKTGAALVLIADPKQAIYAFRGADVYAYLDAAREAPIVTLTVNRRSDQPLLDAYDALFGNAKLGHAGIDYRRVRASGDTAPPRLFGAPLRVRILERASVACTARGFASTPAARQYIADDLAADVARLLASDAEVALRGAAATSRATQRVCPGHVAALVRTNSQAALVMAALERAGIPAVINGAGSVFDTSGARDWLALLEALERPASISRAHAVALTPFVGWPAARVASAGETEWEEVHERLHEWARVLRERGVASLLELVTRDRRLPERLLAGVDGERKLTDVRHIGQLLHAAASAEQLGTTALTAWLRRRIVEAGRDTGDEERSRRLESDAEAVQVLTIHRSKGLEFPIVYVPYLWDPAAWDRRDEPVAYHDPDTGHKRTIDVALEGRDFNKHRQQFVVEERGEDLRLAYVALTRARHQAVMWWAGTYTSRNSPLSRLLFARGPDGTVASSCTSTASDAAAFQAFETLAAQARGCTSVEAARVTAPPRYSPRPGSRAELAVAQFARSLDVRWRRTSYSDITAAAHDARVGTEPEEPVIVDEPDGAAPAAAESAASAEMGTLPSLLGEFPVGTAAGTLVHQVFEATDFAAADLDAELTRALETAPGRHAVGVSNVPAAVAGLRAALDTPLGPLAGGRRLSDIRRADRVDELGFELPLAGGEQPRGALTPVSIAQTLRDWLAPGDPFFEYAARLDDPALRGSVRGYLTGSLDLVVRVAAEQGPRFAIVDYKTNWLAEPEEPLSTWHYRPQALVAEMHERHYGLQALLYLVALHRYLRWRLPGYVPEQHLAGVLYLFVRGMAGPQTPVLDGQRCGVFGWQPPAGLVCALSDTLDRGASG